MSLGILKIEGEVLNAEIVCLGNELLIGRTVNTNATEIALALTKIGFNVTRAVTIQDDHKSAKTEIGEIFRRNPKVLIVSGGLGPTHDDIQLSILADATSRLLKVNNEALDMLAKRYGKTVDDLPATAIKMARIPEGGVALINTEGTAPGVWFKHHETHIFCLPGVPREMRDILQKEVLTRLKQEFKLTIEMIEYGFDMRGAGESSIQPITEAVMKIYPAVNFKSHPKRDDTGYWLSMHTYLLTNSGEQVYEACAHWKKEIEKKFDIKSSVIKPIFDHKFESENVTGDE